MKVWIYFNRKLVHVDKESPKLNWNRNYAPEGMICYTPRKNSPKWQYVDYGDTREECLEKVNLYAMERIERHEKEIAFIKAKLIKDEEV